MFLKTYPRGCKTLRSKKKYSHGLSREDDDCLAETVVASTTATRATDVHDSNRKKNRLKEKARKRKRHRHKQHQQRKLRKRLRRQQHKRQPPVVTPATQTPEKAKKPASNRKYATPLQSILLQKVREKLTGKKTRTPTPKSLSSWKHVLRFPLLSKLDAAFCAVHPDLYTTL